MKHINAIIKTFSNVKNASQEYWFWASLCVIALALSVAWHFIGQAVIVWNQPRVMSVRGGLEKTEVSLNEYTQAANLLRGLIPHEENGQPSLSVKEDATGIVLTGPTLGAYEPFIAVLWQLPGLVANSSWEFDELCLGGGCAGGAVMAKIKARHIQISLQAK